MNCRPGPGLLKMKGDVSFIFFASNVQVNPGLSTLHKAATVIGNRSDTRRPGNLLIREEKPAGLDKIKVPILTQ